MDTFFINLHKGIESFDEEASTNLFHEENEILGMLNDLEASIEHEKETKKGLENEMSFNIEVNKTQQTYFMSY